jgi:hypothetical protein
LFASGQNAESTRFPGWRWAAVAVAFPIAGLIGRAAGGPVDAVGAAVVGGTVTGAALGAGQWLAARGALGDATQWIGSSAVGYGLGLAAGAVLVGYDTDHGSLVTMGAVSGLLLGTAQGLALAAQDRRRLAAAWAAATPLLLAAGWSATTLAGVDVDRRYTVLGAVGAILFTVLSGLVLARFTHPGTKAA